MPKIDLGDVKIHYEEAGQGSLAYIHCHGLGGSGDGFIPDLEFWAGHVGRAVTWDQRGLGKSSAAPKYNLSLYAADLAGMMDALGIQKAIVHGVSWGGVVAQQFGLDHLDKCAAIILDSTSSEVNVAASEAWYKQGEDARTLGKVGEREIKPEHVPSYVANARATASLREHPYTSRLKNITCPVLVFSGGKDPGSGPPAGVIMARNLPKSKLQIIDEAGHGVFRHTPEKFRSLTLEFLKENGLIK